MGKYKIIVYSGLALLLLTGCSARTRTYVNIISEPPGASVSWEGKEVGETPVLMGEIASGNVYDVRLSKKNYKSYSKLLRVEPAERSGKKTLELFVQLEPALVDPSLYDTNMNLM
ncbi:MAG: PEGA domain-containing protein, partial [Candidatus Omnitrophica bacterium]|nr:PEGA domain-containing protein [Candidatus Omnitrophota bacterium]